MLDFIVIQFAKFPQLGKVKTRLAPDIGDTNCLKLHYELMQHTHDTLTHFVNARSDINGLAVLFLDQLGQDEVVSNIAGVTPILLQRGEDLGEKMANALAWGLKRANRVCIVGSDCPVLTEAELSQAFAVLSDNDNVFITAEDGGYVLVGASQLNRAVFADVPWGSGQVMEVTLKRLSENHVKSEILGPLWDVDRIEDYQRLLSVMPNWPSH